MTNLASASGRAMRPSTLLEVSERVIEGADFNKEFSEFLDHFYDRTTNFQMVVCFEDEPLLLRNQRWNALFGATAEYLSKRYRLSAIPGWVHNPERLLDEPWFRETKPEMREYLSYLSPAEFRSRNLFVEAVPLRRARTWQAEERLAKRLEGAWEQEMQVSKMSA